MIAYTHKITPRIQYVFEFIGNQMGGITLTTDARKYQWANEPKINYSRQPLATDEFFIFPHPLLFESNICKQEISCFSVNDHKAFFETKGDFPFDIFAATFYLLSRYEEYLPHKKDMYGRYAHENSVAFRENFLQIPLINYWIDDLKKAIAQKLQVPETILQPQKQQNLSFFQPTYDIDQAWSYKHKQWWRNTGAIAKALLHLNFRQLQERWQIFTNKTRDPFDAYQWMDKLHTDYALKPYYFFIVAAKTGKYDKNILPHKKAMQRLIRHHYYRYPVGIHPSWQSGDNAALLEKEKYTLEKITGGTIIFSRQHYIRFTLPETFQNLIRNRIEFDFSMGYGSINGFRASVALPFYWYDLQNETATNLLLFPFCYMDANSFFEQKFSPGQALDEMRHYYKTVNEVKGMMITIWHNTFLGTDKIYAGWKEVYQQFIEEIYTQQG